MKKFRMQTVSSLQQIKRRDSTFAGKKVLFVPVSDGIHKAEQLIEQIERGNAPVYEHKGSAEDVVVSKMKKKASADSSTNI